MRSLIVLPTYKEAANIAPLLRQIKAAVPSADVLVVDDASPDGTADLAEEVGAELGGVHVMRRPRKSGLGSAYRSGFRWGLDHGYDALVEMDADFSHDPVDLPRLLNAIDDGVGLVIGSRYLPGSSIPIWTWSRRVLSRQGNRYAVFMLRLPLTDATSGFRAYRASMLAELPLATMRANGYGFQVEMAYRMAAQSFKVVEIPISFSDRTRGQSKMSSWIVLEAMALVTWWGIRDRLRPHRRSVTETATRYAEHKA
jgi:glycosyltransferase involved in cell wall biosynthesis